MTHRMRFDRSWEETEIQPPQHQQQQSHSVTTQAVDEDDFEDEALEEDEEDIMEDVEEADEEDVEAEDDDEAHDRAPTPANPPPLPPHLREISSLASWTVSSSKPGCSIPQLRSPSVAHFWQSDGPQPHYLNIHFFKRVSIAGVRLYLDFDADESYTPTRIVFLAGTGYNDLVEWAEMRLEQPRGWCSVDMSNVGRYEYLEDSDAAGDDAHDDSDADSATSDAFPLDSPSVSPSPPGSRSTSTSSLPRERIQHAHPSRPHRRSRRAPTLRCHLLQVKILENHQNGKDTHLRGLQIFARDKMRREEMRVRVPDATAHGATPVGLTRVGGRMAGDPAKELAMRSKKSVLGGLGDWGDGPDLR